VRYAGAFLLEKNMKNLQGLIDKGPAEENHIEKVANMDLNSQTGSRGSGNYIKYARDVNAVGLMDCQGQP
jgi:hypothetical protein